MPDSSPAFDGSFTASGQSFAVGTNPHRLTVADVNGDGKPDLVAANYGSGTVSVLLGNGNGTFAGAADLRRRRAARAPWRSADLNGDGKPDLAVANYSSNSVSVLLGNGNGTLSDADQLYTAVRNPPTVAAADFNGDGRPDLAGHQPTGRRP